jgi:hypothetical protein
MNRKTQIVLMTLCVTLLLAWGGLGTAQAADVYAQWDFNGSLLSTVPGGQAATVDSSMASFKLVPATIGGQTAFVAEVTTGASNRYVRLPFNFDPNGGQADKLGQFTIICDLKMPASGIQPLQPSISTLIMAWVWEDYIYDYAYTSGWVQGPEKLNVGDWNRVVMTVDKTQATGGIKYFFNGGLAGTCDDTNEIQASSLLSTTGSEIGSSVYGGYVSNQQFNSVQFLPYTLTDAQVLALGGPTAAGIPPIGPAAPAPPVVMLGPPSVNSTVTGPVDFPVICIPGVPDVTTVNLTLDKVSLLASEGSVTGTVEITGGTSLNPTITVKDITGFGKLRVFILPGAASNATGPSGSAGPSQAVNVYPARPPLPGEPTAPATGSKLWWDASNINGSNNAGLTNGDPITSWVDRSGNSNNGTPTGAGATYAAAVAGFNNKPAVVFHADKLNEKYDFAASITDVWTVFWAIQAEPSASNYHYILGANETWGGGYGWNSGHNEAIWDGATQNNYTMPEILNGVTRINGEVVDGDVTSLYPYGHAIVSLETAGPAQADFFSGDGRDADWTYTMSWQGDLAELIIYNRALTEQERNDTRRYLADKYTPFEYPDAPVVTLVYPAGSVNIETSTPVALKATATAGAGANIAAVEFYVDWQLIGTVTTPTEGEYVFPWTTPGTAGSHEVFARALDNRIPALAGASAVGIITVVVPPPPLFVTLTGAGSQNGSSWANAMTLDNALAAPSGSELPQPLYIKAGTYPRNADYAFTASKALYGGFAGTETTRAQRTGTPGVDSLTILDGLGTQRGLFSLSVAGLTLTLDRLTLTRSTEVAVFMGIRPVEDPPLYDPATKLRVTLTVNDCIFSDNVAARKTAIEAEGDGSVVTITNSQFLRNSGNHFGHVVSISSWNRPQLGTATIKNCVFKDNINAGHRGGLLIGYPRSVVDSCWFEGNSTAGGDGGAGIYIWFASNTAVKNCVFKNNTAVGVGGAIGVRQCSPYIVNNTFVGNVNNNVDIPADAIMLRCYASTGMEGDPYIANNIFKGHPDNAVGTDYLAPARIVMKNNLLQAGGAGNVNGVAAGITNSGVVTADPLLVSATDFHLQTGSPAINAGTTDPYTIPDGLVVVYPSRDHDNMFRFAGPDLGAYEIVAAGPLTITPNPLSFGVVVKETTSTQTLTLANTGGNLPITISAITPAGTGFSLVDPPAPPVTLLAGGEPLDIVVAFTAPVVTARVPYAGTLTVANTGTVTPAIGSLSAIAAPSLFPGAPPTVLVERSAGTPAATNVFPIEFNITFSEGVTGFELGDINWAGSVPEGNVTATLIPREASGALYTVRISEITGMGAGTWTVNPVVPAGVCETIGKYGNEASNTDAVVTYSTALFGAVIATTASDITAAASVTCTVTFNGQVKAVDARALIVSKLDLAGTSTGASIASVLETNASTAYTVEITTGGDGTLALTLTDDDTIQKASTLAPLNGAGSSVIYGPMIEVDKTSPTLVAIQRAFGAPRGTNETVVVFEVTFSDIVTGVDAGDFTVTCNDLTADVASVATLGNTALVVCNVKAAVGTYALSVKTAATMTNRVGLGYETATPDPNETYFILTQAPQTSVETWSWTLY